MAAGAALLLHPVFGNLQLQERDIKDLPPFIATDRLVSQVSATGLTVIHSAGEAPGWLIYQSQGLPGMPRLAAGLSAGGLAQILNRQRWGLAGG